LNGFGFVVPAKEDPLLLGCTFASQKFEGRAPEGHVLLRAFLGDEAMMLYQQQGEEMILSGVIERVKHILGISKNPVSSRMTLYRSSMSYFKPGHVSQVSRLEQKASEFRGLHLAGNGLKGVGIPDCVSAGESAAEKIFQNIFAADSRQ
jgi:oxygen-dependent protoporphyrinogen oxidase